MAEQKVDVNINLDTTPVLYTDNIVMHVNEDGVILEVLQRISSSNAVRIVSRIGMSKIHAKKFLVEFGRLLALTEGKKETGSNN